MYTQTVPQCARSMNTRNAYIAEIRNEILNMIYSMEVEQKQSQPLRSEIVRNSTQEIKCASCSSCMYFNAANPNPHKLASNDPPVKGYCGLWEGSRYNSTVCQGWTGVSKEI